MEEFLLGFRCEECGQPINPDEYYYLSEDKRYDEDAVYIEHKECAHPDDEILDTYQSLVLVRCLHDD